MYRLRSLQNVLNGFWSSTELCYGYLLSRSDIDFSNPGQRTEEVHGHVPSQVWYPNNQGRIKRDETVATFLERIQQNTVHVYRATLLSFYSAFEAYLDDRVALVTGPRRHWGPFLDSLAVSRLKEAPCAVRLRTVLCADVCREIRNMMIHEFMTVPVSLADPSVSTWQGRLAGHVERNDWAAGAGAADVAFALNQVIGQADSHLKQAASEGKRLPIELFYMLFTFTNLDSLAFEIEEALIASRTEVQKWVWRKSAAVRRQDLIMPSEAGAA
jgi:hypothetical protein